MKFKAAAAGVFMAAALVACGGSPKDQPDADAIAGAYQIMFDTAYPPVTGLRMQIESWHKMTYECDEVDGPVKRVDCELGGKIAVAGYTNGVQNKEGVQETDAEGTMVFEKRGEGVWAFKEFIE